MPADPMTPKAKLGFVLTLAYLGAALGPALLRAFMREYGLVWR